MQLQLQLSALCSTIMAAVAAIPAGAGQLQHWQQCSACGRQQGGGAIVLLTMQATPTDPTAAALSGRMGFGSEGAECGAQRSRQDARAWS